MRLLHPFGRLRGPLWAVAMKLAGETAHLLAYGQHADQVTAALAGTGPEGDGKLCLFVHFDRHGVLRPHTRRYLAALGEAGFRTVLISNGGWLQPESAEAARSLCAEVLLRRNRGYDFGAWRDGLARHAPEGAPWRMVLLTNDSLYGPFAPLRGMVERVDFGAADVWGATDSWQHGYHLQSFWLALGPVALADPRCRAFWAGIRNVRSKWAVIRHGELRFSRVLVTAGLRLASLFEYTALIDGIVGAPPRGAPGEPDSDDPEAIAADRAQRAARRRLAMNPSLELWRPLLLAGFPFLKRELLRDDPLEADDILLWHAFARAAGAGVHAEILADLRRVRRDGAP